MSFEYVTGSVAYRPPWSPLSSISNSGPTTRKPDLNSEVSSHLHLARLYPNVRGCGYPPELNCEDFFEKFGGSRNFSNPNLPEPVPFTCWVSTVDSSIAMTELDLVTISNTSLILHLISNVYLRSGP